jgi:HlyD family secretion protein
MQQQRRWVPSIRKHETDNDSSIRRHLFLVGASFAFLVGSAATLGAAVDVSGAVIASGHLVVDSELKKVQHPTGGVVAEVLVENGARVGTGDVLVRLDQTIPQATLNEVSKELWELTARRARLESERDAAGDVSFPEDLMEAAAEDASVEHMMTGERRLFGFRKETQEGQKDQLRERISQLRLEIGGMEQQIAAKKSEIDLVTQELEGVEDLWKQKLTPLTRLLSLQREAARLKGEAGELTARLAETHGRISETDLQIIQLDLAMRSDAGKELAEIRAKMSSLAEKKVAAEDQLSRVRIRAPQDGIVHQLSVHTKGGVIAAGEQLMMIVPDMDALAVEVRILPKDIDQVVLDQDAKLRFTNLNQHTTPEIDGVVSRVAADTAEDDRTDQPYYIVRIRISGTDRLKGLELVPGMPVDAFISTGSRSMASYLFKPLADQVRTAFRER